MDIYMERILELYKNQPNSGEIANAQVKEMDYNPSCGDAIRIFAKVHGGRIEEVKFKGQGCAISIASASLLAGEVKGKTTAQVMQMGQADVFRMLGLDLSRNPSRIKCAMLALDVLKKGLRGLGKEK